MQHSLEIREFLRFLSGDGAGDAATFDALGDFGFELGVDVGRGGDVEHRAAEGVAAVSLPAMVAMGTSWSQLSWVRPFFIHSESMSSFWREGLAKRWAISVLATLDG